MMEEIRQLKIDKTKEKGSQYVSEHAVDKEEKPIGGAQQNAEQCFITMAEVAAFLEQERARALKERFYARRPPYPLRVLSKPYLERWEDIQSDPEPNLRKLLSQKKKRKEAPTTDSDDTPQCVRVRGPNGRIIYKI
ncbi:hypothetical protein SO802_033186 [Lithocarpus litseifolius]|uniref:Uncharacterized protein n=1 Tax=Lithocarpus litseifolius TaxID=425828 RepID=A0AAW2BCG3_9ROSI